MTALRRKRGVQSLYTEGLDHLLRGNLKLAYQCFKGVIDRDTDHIAAYLKLGQVMRQGGAPERALKLHESLLARPSLTTYDQIELRKELALDQRELGRHEQSVEETLAILRLDKRNTWALRQLVRSYRDLGDWEAAGKSLAQWQKATRKEDTRFLAYCRFRQGYDQRDIDPPSTVRSHYRQALKIDEEFAPAHYYLSDSYASEASIYRIELTANERSADEKTIKRNQDLQEKIAKLYSQAISHWSAFVELSPTDTGLVLPHVEDTLFYLKRFDDVEPFLRQVLDQDPDNLDGVASLANFYVRKGDLDRAEQLLNTIPEDATSSPLIGAIQLKLDYRRNAQQNLMPQLDRLVDSIRLLAEAQLSRRDAHASLMSWLDPSSDPLEQLE